MTKIPSILDDTLPFASESKNNNLEPEFDAAYSAWKNNDNPQTRAALLRKSQPVIDRAVYTYGGASASPAVKSQAKLMALDAFRSYDPQKGNMKNHLLSRLRRIQRVAAQGNQIISVPERVALDRRQLQEAEESLRDTLGRDPSDAEIADYTGLSLRRLSNIRRATTPVNTGSILDEEGEVFSPASRLPGEAGNDDAWTQMVYYDLDATNQAIMDYTLGLHGTPVIENREIAKRLGLTPGAVSQRKAKIQELLDEKYTSNPFGGE